MAKDIVLYLIQSKVMMPPEIWKDVLESLLPLLTVLQVHY